MEVSVASFRKRYQYQAGKDLLNKDGLIEIYKAWDTEQEKFVAVKIYAVDGSSGFNLINEVISVKKLRHPNLVEHYEVYEIKDSEYDLFDNALGNGRADYQIVSMEYADKGSIADLLKNGPLTVQEVKDYTTEVIACLSHLHNFDTPHGSLIPGHILLFSDGAGIKAKLTSPEVSSVEFAPQGPDVFPGREIPYMAPEYFLTPDMAQGRTRTTAGDIWSLGLIVLEMLTGANPFENTASGKDVVINNILNMDLSPAISQLPQPFDQVVAKCLVRNSTWRLQNVSGLSDFLNWPVNDEKAAKKRVDIIVPDIIVPDKIVPDKIEKSETPSIAESPVIETSSPAKSQIIVSDSPEKNEPLSGKYFREPVSAQTPQRNKLVIASLTSIFILLCVLMGIYLFPWGTKKPTAAVQPVQASTPVSTPQDTSVEANPGTTQSTADNASTQTEERIITHPKNSANNMMGNKPGAEAKKVKSDTTYCFVTMLVSFRDAKDTSGAKKDTAAGTGSQICHYWSNIFRLYCDKKDIKGKIEEKIKESAKSQFQSTHSEKNFNIDEAHAKIYATHDNAMNEEEPFRVDPYKEYANFRFDIDETVVNKTLCNK